jgi:hypothetical protein
MAASSPIESLRRLAPVSDDDAAAVFGAAGREDLLAGVTSLRFGRRPRLLPATRRRRLVLAVAVVALVAIASAGTWAVLRAPARETTSVECMNAADNSDAVIPSVSGDPAYDCAQAWQGAFGTAPPPLAAYDNGLGGVTVIPRSQKPAAGWTPLETQDVALIELQESLDDYINGLESGCFDGAAATSLTEAKLAQFGLTGWTVTLRTPQSGAAPAGCYGGEVIEPATKTVTLIPFGSPGNGEVFQKLAAKLQPATQSCLSLPAAVAAVRAAGDALGLSPAPPATVDSYDLSTVTDNSLRCALITETVGGTIFLTVRGPSD